MRRLLVVALLLAGLVAPPAVLAQVGTPGVSGGSPTPSGSRWTGAVFDADPITTSATIGVCDNGNPAQSCAAYSGAKAYFSISPNGNWNLYTDTDGGGWQFAKPAYSGFAGSDYSIIAQLGLPSSTTGKRTGWSLIGDVGVTLDKYEGGFTVTNHYRHNTVLNWSQSPGGIYSSNPILVVDTTPSITAGSVEVCGQVSGYTQYQCEVIDISAGAGSYPTVRTYASLASVIVTGVSVLDGGGDEMINGVPVEDVLLTTPVVSDQQLEGGWHSVACGSRVLGCVWDPPAGVSADGYITTITPKNGPITLQSGVATYFPMGPHKITVGGSATVLYDANFPGGGKWILLSMESEGSPTVRVRNGATTPGWMMDSLVSGGYVIDGNPFSNAPSLVSITLADPEADSTPEQTVQICGYATAAAQAAYAQTCETVAATEGVTSSAGTWKIVNAIKGSALATADADDTFEAAFATGPVTIVAAVTAANSSATTYAAFGLPFPSSYSTIKCVDLLGCTLIPDNLVNWVPDPAVFDGYTITLMALPGTTALVFDDDDTLLELAGDADLTLGALDTLTLLWVESVDKWVQVAASNN